MTIEEKAKLIILVSLLEEETVDVTVLSEKAGLDNTGFKKIFKELVAAEFISESTTDGFMSASITSSGLNYLLKLKTVDVKESVKDSKFLKVVKHVASKKKDSLGGKLTKASDKFTDLLIKKAKELEEAKENKKAGITPTKEQEDTPKTTEAPETQEDIISKILNSKGFVEVSTEDVETKDSKEYQEARISSFLKERGFVEVSTEEASQDLDLKNLEEFLNSQFGGDTKDHK